jgi:predicted nucleic acid-binding protein
MVLEAALNGRADAIVTHNVRDFASAAAKFSLRVVRPADFVREMAK